MKRAFGCEHNGSAAWNTEVNWATQVSRETTSRAFAGRRGERPAVVGDRVILANIKRRPELNGLVGEVQASDPDEAGFLTVHLQRGQHARPRKMKVHPCRLLPLDGDEGHDMGRTLSWMYPLGSPSQVLAQTSPLSSRLDGVYTPTGCSTQTPSVAGSWASGADRGTRAASSAGSGVPRRGPVASESCPVLPSLATLEARGPLWHGHAAAKRA